jgi:hypothetical protein
MQIYVGIYWVANGNNNAKLFLYLNFYVKLHYHQKYYFLSVFGNDKIDFKLKKKKFYGDMVLREFKNPIN